MNKMIIASLMLLLANVANSADLSEAAIKTKYQQSCFACHSTGAAGAPKTGVPEQWADRMKKGMDVMVANVDKGMNAMPPKGMCFDCTAEQFEALINYMMAPQK